MKLDTSILSNENFKITEHIIAGERCIFVRPTPFQQDLWDENNLIYRSSIWNSTGDLISAGYPKFFNFEEKPSLNPFNGNIFGCSITEKIDGSCLIVSKYRGDCIIRTRGNINAYDMPNKIDLDFLKYEYREFFDDLNANALDTEAYSFIFEWTSPDNKIVIGYGSKPDLYLTNIISHSNYELFKQEDLDLFAKEYHLKRPTRYTFNTLSDLLNSVKTWEGKEGVCLYYNDDQNIRKIKSSWYLMLHTFKSNCNVNSLLDLYFSWNMPIIENFKEKLKENFDYECLKMADSVVNHIYDNGIFPAQQDVQVIKEFVERSKDINQKLFALTIQEKFSNKVHQSIGFALRKNSTYEKSFRTLIEEKIKTFLTQWIA